MQSLINKYDFFLFDQWGVLHDGDKLYKFTNNTLKKIIILNYSSTNHVFSMNNNNISSIFSNNLFDKPSFDGKLNSKFLQQYSGDFDIMPYSINFIDL